MERELLQIRSEAYKEVEIIKGEADATATETYAKAYNQSPDAAKFYEFVKTMEIYPELLNKDSTVILSTDSDLFQFLKEAEPGDAAE
jgi:membrane protease subunit HflC